MIEVFKTSIPNEDIAGSISQVLHHLLDLTNIAFDLEDCDRILRVESEQNYNQIIIKTLDSLGFECEVLPD